MNLPKIPEAISWAVMAGDEIVQVTSRQELAKIWSLKSVIRELVFRDEMMDLFVKTFDQTVSTLKLANEYVALANQVYPDIEEKMEELLKQKRDKNV